MVWEQPNATDNSGRVDKVICTPQARNQFVIGQSMVTCEAVDGAGNNATCYFYVDVTGMLKLLTKCKMITIAVFFVFCFLFFVFCFLFVCLFVCLFLLIVTVCHN